MSLLSFLSNPVTLAAAAVIAIGVVIYEIVSHQEESRVPNSRGGRGPKKPGRGSGPSNSPNFAFYDNSGSNIRRRKLEEANTEPCSSSKVIKHEENAKLSKDLKESGSAPNSEFDEKNYYKNVFDKIESDVKNINQVDDKTKTFHKNIPDGAPDLVDSATVNPNEPKLINTSILDANQEDVHKNKRGISCNTEERENIASSSGINPTNCSGPSLASGANNLQNTISDIGPCRACEGIIANAVAYPCKHCYLCADCAVMVYRIYKKCTICESQIDSFKTVER